jgi:hypothetical protein
MIPLYGFLQGDTIGLLILAREEDTIAELAERLQVSAAVRVRRRDPVEVRYNDQVLDLRSTVGAVGLTALDRFDVGPVDQG